MELANRGYTEQRDWTNKNDNDESVSGEDNGKNEKKQQQEEDNNRLWKHGKWSIVA